MFRTRPRIPAMTQIAGVVVSCFMSVSLSAAVDAPEIENNAAAAESVPEDTLSTTSTTSIFSVLINVVPTLAELDRWTQSNDETERSFNFAVMGDRVTKSINLMTTLPIRSGYLRGHYFLVRHAGKIISRSYMLQLESDFPYTRFHGITPRGHFEVENDPILDTDPHLHLSVYDDFTVWDTWDWLKGGVGFWAEVVSAPENLTAVKHAEYENLRGGFRGHFEIKGKHKWATFDMEIEYLHHLRFDRYLYSVRTSPELKIEIWNDISLMILGEIDYSSERGALTVEPWVDIFKPLETSWTHLWSIKF